MSLQLQRFNPLLSPKVVRHGWVIIVCGLLFASYNYLQVLRKPDRFRSAGKMYVSGRVILSDTPTTYAEELANYLGTQIEIMRSQEIHDRSIQRLTLDGVKPEADASLHIKTIKGTTILELSSESGNAEYARFYLDALMAEYIEFKRDRRLAVSETTVEQISEEVTRLEQLLNEQETAFFQFRENRNIGVWEQQSSDSAVYLAQLRRREADLRLELSLLDNWRQIVEQGEVSLAAQVEVPGIGEGETGTLMGEGLLDIRRELNRLQVERDLRMRSLRPAHPLVQALDREIEKLTLLEKAEAQELLLAQEERRLALTSEIISVQQAIDEWELKALESSRVEAEYQKLKDAKDRTKNLYDRMLASLHSIDVGKGVNQELVQVLQPATLANPIRPEYRQATIQGAILGLMVGWGVVWLLVRVDDRVYHLESAVDYLDCAALGEVPLLSNARISGRRRRYEKSAFEESFRRMRSLLTESSSPSKLGLLVTSSLASEGKTEIAVQLGRAFALTGKKVLLVDADLRRGRMKDIFKEVSVKSSGLAAWLPTTQPPDEVVVETDVPNMWMVPRGDKAPDAGELLSRSQVKARLDELKQGYDVVIIDSAPIGPVDDTTHLISSVDQVLFVLRHGSTSLRAAANNVERLKSVGAKVTKLVLNGVKPKVSSKYYNYYR